MYDRLIRVPESDTHELSLVMDSDASRAPEQLELFDLSQYERQDTSLWCEGLAA
jgi:hypothetical protein